MRRRASRAGCAKGGGKSEKSPRLGPREFSVPGPLGRIGPGRRLLRKLLLGIAAGDFERARRMLALGLQAGRPAQAFADADDVVVARAEPLVGVLVGVAGFVERRADTFERSRESH